MKKRQKDLWQNRSETDQSTEYRSISQILMQIVVLYAISLLFFYSAVEFLNNLIPVLDLTMDGCFLIWFLILLVIAWNVSMGTDQFDLIRQIGNVSFIVIMAVALYWYYCAHHRALDNGSFAIASSYIDKWNRYYHVQFMFPHGNPKWMPWAFTYASVIAVAIVASASGVCRKVWIMAILPGLTLSLDLLVGHAPEWRPLAFLFVGVIFCFSGTWRRKQGYTQFAVLAAGSGLMVLLISVVFTGASQKLVSRQKEVLTFQNNLERTIRNFCWKDHSVQNGSVDNHQPEYTGAEVMQLSVSAIPDSNVYLRGYFASDYVNGHWSLDRSQFENACKEHQMTTDKAAKLLNVMAYDRQSQYYPIKDNQVLYTIKYKNSKESYAYMPYLVDLAKATDIISFSGDYEIRKLGNLKSIQVTGNRFNNYIAHDSQIQPALDKLTAEETEFASWYNEYVMKHYLNVPKGQTAAKNLVHQMEDYDAVKAMLNTQGNQDVGSINRIRVSLADDISKLLGKTAAYNMNLKQLEVNTDPVQYFLTQSYEGYCVHFASAGVFMLRAMGVPARYCTGYIAKKGDYKKVDSSYVNSIKDSNAHSWVEIYLQNYGWVPVEMTSGYYIGKKEQPDQSQVNNKDKNPGTGATTQPNKTDPAKEPEAKDPSTKQNNTNEIQDKKENPNGNSSNVAGQETTNGNTNETNAGHSHKNIVAVILLIIVAGGFVAGSVYWYWRWQHSIQQRLSRQISKKRYASAIRYMNRLLYRKCRHRFSIHMGKISDEEYQNLLSSQYPEISEEDWEQYMQIVKKAAFSHNKSSEEEVQYISDIYTKCTKIQQELLNALKRNKKKD